MRLEALQRALLAAVAPDGAASPDLAALLAGAPAAGLAVHRRNGAGARVNALVQIHPATVAVVGEPCFRGLAARWVARFPARTGSLEEDGAGFGPWLAAATRRARGYRALPYLGDLARLEWLHHAAAGAPEAPVFDHAGFARLGPRGPRARLRLAPGLGLLTTPWPVRALHAAHLQGRAPARLAGLEAPEHLVVWRAGDAVRVVPATPAEAAALGACARGRCLATVARHCARAGGDPPDLLPALIARGWIGGFTAPEGGA